MRTIQILFAFLTLSSMAFSQYMPASVEVEQFNDAIKAKAVRTELLADGTVAVFLTDRQPGETGAFLKVTSTAKWATPFSLDDGVSIAMSQGTPGLWMMFAKPGDYKVLLIETDLEKGQLISKIAVKVLPKPPTKPDDPVTSPPVSDFGALTNVVKTVADRLNDPPTRSALKSSMQALQLTGKTYDEVRAIVTSSRQAVFLARQGTSRTVDWDSWRIAVDVELKKSVAIGDAEKYRAAIAAIATAL